MVQVILELRVLKETREPTATKELKVLRVVLEQLEPRVLKETREPTDTKELRVLKVE